MSGRKTLRVLVVVCLVAIGAVVGASVAGGSTHTKSRSTAPIDSLLAWIKSNKKAPKTFKIAYVKQDANNPYTIAALNGAKAAAKKYGATLKVYDARFNPTTQVQQFQDAVTAYKAHKFDAFLVEPVAGAVVCSIAKNAIKAGIPISVVNVPLCGVDGYMAGTVGYAGMQLQRYHNAHIENALKSCKAACEAAVITGPVGFENVTKEQKALKQLLPKYPNVKIVSNQATDYSAPDAYKKMRDALTAHPKISLVISGWDDEILGVVQAITQAGKKPGTDVRIYSNGADKTGVGLIKKGQMTATAVLMPREEGQYGIEMLMRYLITKQKTTGTVWLGDSPLVKQLGSLFVTKANVNRWKPEY
jgi:galactofuranose transport system substrate-binding protein